VRVVKFAGRLLLLFIGALCGAALASGVAAAVMKPRLPDRSKAEDDELDLVAIYDSRELRSTASSFRGGRLICWYAGADLDLRGAQLDPFGAGLLVWTVFGGTRIRVPEDWRVDSKGIALFGGAYGTASRPEPPFDGPVLHIRHRTIFGGFGVLAEPDDELLAV